MEENVLVRDGETNNQIVQTQSHLIQSESCTEAMQPVEQGQLLVLAGSSLSSSLECSLPLLPEPDSNSNASPPVSAVYHHMNSEHTESTHDLVLTETFQNNNPCRIEYCDESEIVTAANLNMNNPQFDQQSETEVAPIIPVVTTQESNSDIIQMDTSDVQVMPTTNTNNFNIDTESANTGDDDAVNNANVSEDCQLEKSDLEIAPNRDMEEYGVYDQQYCSSVQTQNAPEVAVESDSSNYQQAAQTFIGPQIPDRSQEFTTLHSPVLQQSLDSTFSFTPTYSLHCVNKAASVFTKQGQENFLRGCKWCPDGTQILTNSNDNILRTFTPMSQATDSDHEMNPSCVMKESGLVYDYCWFPGKTDSKPDSCRVACSCPGSPVHLWDSNYGNIVSSYRAFDHCDEITPAYSVSFSPDGSKLYGGYKNSIRIFDTEYSHRRCTMINTLNPKTKEGHRGIVSCFCHGAPGSNTFVTGSYSRHVGIYYSLTNEMVCLIQGQQGGVTHIMLSPDGSRLYTGGRKDPEIVCWDMRNTGQVLCTYLRDVQTNQRIYFDLSQSGRYLVSGNHDGSVQVWDTQQAGHEVEGEIIMKPCYVFQAHKDCTNGISFNPHNAMLATASGQRHFKDYEDSDTDSDEDKSSMNGDEAVQEFSLKIWSIPCVTS